MYLLSIMGGPIVIALFQFLQICRVKQSGLRVHLGLRSPAYTSSVNFGKFSQCILSPYFLTPLGNCTNFNQYRSCLVVFESFTFFHFRTILDLQENCEDTTKFSCLTWRATFPFQLNLRARKCLISIFG